MTPLSLPQLKAEGTTVSWVPGLDHLFGPQLPSLYPDVFRLNTCKDPSQPYVIFFDSKTQETTWSSGPVTTAQVKRQFGWCQGMGRVGPA